MPQEPGSGRFFFMLLAAIVFAVVFVRAAVPKVFIMMETPGGYFSGGYAPEQALPGRGPINQGGAGEPDYPEAGDICSVCGELCGYDKAGNQLMCEPAPQGPGTAGAPCTCQIVASDRSSQSGGSKLV